MTSLLTWLKRNWKALALLIGGAYILGISLGFFAMLWGFLLWFTPLLQMLIAIGTVTFGIALVTHPVKTVKTLRKLWKELTA